MLDKIKHHGDWVCFAQKPIEMNIPDIDELLEKINGFADAIKDDKRSLVKKGSLFNIDVIAKQPVDKNRRRWTRILSLFREGEAKQTFSTLMRFQQASIASVRPLLVLEKRHYGVLIDSWLLYEYREGMACSAEHLPRVIELLDKVHAMGLRHDDPNFGNFLLDTNGELFLIDCKGKKRLGHFTDYYDYLLLAQRNRDITLADIEKWVKFNKDSWSYRFACLYSNYKNRRTELKKRFRKQS